ncbi:helix-turn-helix domain-containing protein [Salinibaculum salinum]|uniref:helix-turn-helix domain-containing protein n=1 Tax=Salinibaculum salinum TaxID=3131996 RepID=UPI0030EF77C8
MSESQVIATTVGTAESSSEDVETIVSEDDVQPLLDALDDPDCRTILDVTSDDALSAKEVSVICDLPLSTAYRKLDLLTSAGLVEEQTRVCRSGKHASEYSRVVEQVTVSLGWNGGVKLQVSQSDGTEYACPIVSTTDD